ncbi:MAG: hypothetical protein AABM42_12070 [Actinomycetota bacterium]
METYYAEQRASLRPGTYNRLHLNQWQSGQEAFVTAEQWDACVHPAARPAWDRRELSGPVFAGVDAATKADCAAVVAVMREEGRLRLVAHKIWTPRKGAPLDLELTIEAYLRDLAGRLGIAAAYFDPYQLQRSAVTLRNRGVRMVEYPQTTDRLTASTSALYDAIKARRLAVYGGADDLRSHVLNAAAVESARGWRLAKEKAARKIDGAVALSFAVLAAMRQASGEVRTERWMPTDTPQMIQRGGLHLAGARYQDRQPGGGLAPPPGWEAVDPDELVARRAAEQHRRAREREQRDRARELREGPPAPATLPPPIRTDRKE